MVDGPDFDFAVSGESLDADYDSVSNANAPNTVDKRLLSGFARATWPSDEASVEHSLTGFAMKSLRNNLEPGSTIPLSEFDAFSFGAEFQRIAEAGALGTLLFGARVEREIAGNEAAGAGFLGYDSDRSLWASYLQDQLTLHDGRLNLVIGGRYDGDFAGEGFLTWRATAAYQIVETATRLRASVGTGAKRPTAYQIGNNNFAAAKYPLAEVQTELSPETSFGADAGIEQELLGGAVRISGTGFYNRFRDLIAFEFIAGGDGAYRNVANAETAGLELTGDLELIPGVLKAGGSYTYLLTRDDKGKQLARRPRNGGSLSVTFTPEDRWEGVLSAVFVGRRFNSSAEVGPLPAYVRVDLYGSYALSPETRLFARVENLADVRYQDPGGFNTPGRTATVGLSWRR
jgi:vitamin B12 transporter